MHGSPHCYWTIATAADAPAHRFLDDVLSVGLTAVLQRPELGDDAVQIAAMQTALTTGALSGLTIQGLAERARKTGRVEVTTMTSSKGLEFDVVFILGLDEDRVPFCGQKPRRTR